jgi:N-acetylglutamate synthase-like GNAT family acetyltransferase
MVVIENFKKEYATAFRDLNMAWLQEFFVAEPYDIEVLSKPEKYILDKGGDIYFVVENGLPIGTVALMYNKYNELEFTKMAVDPKMQGKGYGKLLMNHCIDEARKMGASELILYSNTKLNPAIELYRTSGFEEIDIENSEYERCNIKMVKMLKDK